MDKKSGKGTWTKGEESYVGAFYSNLSNGYGIWKHPGGDMYKGYFKDDLFHSQGTYIYKDGFE